MAPGGRLELPTNGLTVRCAANCATPEGIDRVYQRGSSAPAAGWYRPDRPKTPGRDRFASLFRIDHGH